MSASFVRVATSRFHTAGTAPEATQPRHPAAVRALPGRGHVIDHRIGPYLANQDLAIGVSELVADVSAVLVGSFEVPFWPADVHAGA